MSMLKKICQLTLPVMLIFTLSAGSVYADADTDMSLKQELLEWSERQTSIATKTRHNADFVPDIVTVLFGDDLENRGIRTVKDALSLVPGMYLSREGHGAWENWTRGVEGTSVFRDMKTLVNGIPMVAGGWLAPVLNMPVEQVKRITD